MRGHKLFNLFLSSILMFSLLGCQKEEDSVVQQQFDEFMEQEFVDSLESDYVTMHILTENPESYGVDADEVEVNLGTRLDPKTLEASLDEENESYKTFKSFNRNQLTEKQKDEYDAYAFDMKIDEASNDEKYLYYAQYFSSMTGLHYNLPTTFSDWILRDEQDVKDLITLVEDVEDYVDGAIEYTKMQADKGLLMTDLESVREYCQSIVDAGEDSAILTSMNENIDALNLENGAQYKEELKTAFVSSFLTAYQNLVDMAEELEDAGTNNEEGYAKFEDGKEYYELVLKNNVSADLSAKEVKQMMEEAFQDHLLNLQVYASQNPEALNQLVSGNLPSTGFTSYEEIMEYSKNHMFDSFPEVGDLNYVIKDINEEIASDSGVAAYFIIPALDGDDSKQLRVNPKGSDLSSISTYSTVCHEGFPGHMYQTAYMYENVDSNYIKAFSSANAYVEGFAVYAENSALEYLDGIDSTLLNIYRENELASYCLIVAADIGIHYEGWSLEEFTEYLDSYGFSMDEESAEVQYNQLQANPAAFEPYYAGYTQIMNLKEEVQNKLGDSFNEKEFNQALLESGNVCFEVVERHIQNYVQTKK